MSEFGVSIDLLAAMLTFLYIAKLLFQAHSEKNGMAFGGDRMEKRSLLNQQIVRRVSP